MPVSLSRSCYCDKLFPQEWSWNCLFPPLFLRPLCGWGRAVLTEKPASPNYCSLGLGAEPHRWPRGIEPVRLAGVSPGAAQPRESPLHRGIAICPCEDGSLLAQQEVFGSRFTLCALFRARQKAPFISFSLPFFIFINNIMCIFRSLHVPYYIKII